MSNVSKTAQILLAIAALLIVLSAIAALIDEETWNRVISALLAILGLIFGAAGVREITRFQGGVSPGSVTREPGSDR